MELKGVKNIILDLGGVIINLNQELTIKAFQQLFGNQFEEIQQQLNTNKFLEKVETSEISAAEFIAFFQKFDSSISIAQITQAWNSMLLDIPKERIDLIKKLSKNYKVYLLSNTNEIHYQHIEDYALTQFKIESFKKLFKQAYLSHEIKLRKPNSSIFKYVLNDKNMLPEETLFVDDTLEHINTAKALGIQTEHLNLTNNESLIKLFHEH